MSNLLIIGRKEKNNLSGPGVVIDSLMSGLDKNGVQYEFFNTFKESKIHLFLSLIGLLFSTKKNINVHTYGYKVPILIYIISKVNKKNKYFLTVHGISSVEASINGHDSAKKIKRLDSVEKILFGKFPNIICASKILEDYIVKKFNRQSNLHRISIGLDEKKYTQVPLTNKTGFLFMYSGGFSNIKNPLAAISLFEKIHFEHNDSRLYICGPQLDTKLFNECIKYIHAHNLDGVITIDGLIDKSHLIKKYMESDYILAPSIFDTFNISVLEAMEYGCVPIISNQCGIKDLLGKENGVIINLDSDRIAVKDILLNYSLKQQSSIMTARNNNDSKMASQYMKAMCQEKQ